MASVKYKGFEYEIPAPFTNREMMFIENTSGKSAGEIGEAMKTKRLTWGAMVAISHVAMARNGATVELDELLDADMEALTFEGDKPEAVASVTPGPLDSSASVEAEPEPTAITTVTPAPAGSPS